MISDDERIKLQFELANANLQSVSRAQGVYLTALLVYICLVWTMFLTGATAIHLESLELKMDAVWKVTPFVTMILTLAVVGTINATNSAYSELREIGTAMFGSDFGTLFAVDTHKNVVDYLALLQLVPWKKTRKPTDARGGQSLRLRLHHLIFPSLFIISLTTSYYAVRGASVSPRPHFFLVFGWLCLGTQTLYSIRPIWRWFGRLFGASGTHYVYN